MKVALLVAVLSVAQALVLPACGVRGVVGSSSLRCQRPIAQSAEVEKEEEKEDRVGAGGRGGHAVRNQPELSDEERAVQTAVMEHQRGAARLSQAEDARSLVAYNSGYAILSTLSSSVDGYPSGSLVGFALDDHGLPVFCFSTMSSHTKDLLASNSGGKAALCVTAKGFEGAADGRVTLIGDVKRCSKEEVEEDGLRELYKTKHPNAFWADFGDFSFFRMEELKAVTDPGSESAWRAWRAWHSN